MLFFFFTHSNAQDKSNLKACKEVEIYLNQVDSFLKGETDKNLKRIKAVHYLEVLTGIQSESDGTDIGKFNPTEKDYSLWGNGIMKINKSFIMMKF